MHSTKTKDHGYLGIPFSHIGLCGVAFLYVLFSSVLNRIHYYSPEPSGKKLYSLNICVDFGPVWAGQRPLRKCVDHSFFLWNSYGTNFPLPTSRHPHYYDASFNRYIGNVSRYYSDTLPWYEGTSLRKPVVSYNFSYHPRALVCKYYDEWLHKRSDSFASRTLLMDRTSSFSDANDFFSKPQSFPFRSLNKDTASSNHRNILVLGTTAEGNLTPAIENTLTSMRWFQRHYNVKCIIFTHTPAIIDHATKLKIATYSDYEISAFGLPTARYMLQYMKSNYPSEYIGYMNSDIILSPNLVNVLSYLNHLVYTGSLSPKHLIAGRAIEISTVLPFPKYPSRKKYWKYLSKLLKTGDPPRDRNVYSADYFLFSSATDFLDMLPVTIARESIDNYLMNHIEHVGGQLIDGTMRLLCFHQGFDGYLTRTAGLDGADVMYNSLVDTRIKSFCGHFCVAEYFLGMDLEVSDFDASSPLPKRMNTTYLCPFSFSSNEPYRFYRTE